MRLIKQTSYLAFLLAVVILFSSWGHVGHNKINTNASLSFNQEMSLFYEWTSILAAHASDADIRKGWDPTEGPKHYIDIDNYPGFIENGVIPQEFDLAIELYGESFVFDQGILPWATRTTFDSLQSCFERGDWEQAVLFASDLGHYVADGHMPLHITRNYNGQYTGNNGIHSRYESDMIGTFNSQIDYQGYQIEVIDDVDQYIFNYLYSNYTYIDSILAADDYARDIAGNTYSSQYYSALWDKTESITIELFKEASHSLTELIYTAWVNSGSPTNTGIFSPAANNLNLQLHNSPNPFAVNTKISFSLTKASQIVLEIRDISGRPVCTLIDEYKFVGKYQLNWDAYGIEPGVYYAVLRSRNFSQTCKLIKVD